MAEHVAVFDTTLRDGEQAAGTRLGSRDKLIIARQLAQLRVDVIEAGYPASSPEDSDAVQRIAREIRGPVDLRAFPRRPARHRGVRQGAGRLPAAAHPHGHRRVRYPYRGQVSRRALRRDAGREEGRTSCGWPSKR